MGTKARPNVSDTARWVAAFRARESARPDAVFRDPYAARLAGDLGEQMAQNIYGRWGDTSWPIIARTVIIDDLVQKSISEGADRVLNLAAGLDTRPYRMALPAGLQWIEADLPAMIDEKSEALAGETPRCKLLRERVDLSNREARSAFLSRALDGAKKALVLTEGLLIYLTADQVTSLARDLHSHPEVAFWMHDLVSPAVRRMLQKGTAQHLGESASMKFGPANGVAFFTNLGWRPIDIRSMMQEAKRLDRLPWYLKLVSYLPEPPADNPGKRPWSAVVRHARA